MNKRAAVAIACLWTMAQSAHAATVEDSVRAAVASIPTLEGKETALKTAHGKLVQKLASQSGAVRTKSDKNLLAVKSAIEKFTVSVPYAELKAESSAKAVSEGKATLFAVAEMPAPVLYRKDFSAVFGTETGTGLLLDEYGQIDPLEYIALKGATFRVLEILSDNGNPILKVADEGYPYENGGKGYYVDARFVRTYLSPLAPVPKASKKAMPKAEEISSRLLDMEGLPYVWWGNAPAWVPGMLRFYAPTGAAEYALSWKWTLRGVDCSGLLYAATDGNTPRNTSELVHFWTGIAIAGNSAEEIAQKLRPLDLIAWKGHVIIVLDGETTIESAYSYPDGTPGFPDGVKVRKISDVLNHVFETRLPVDSIDDPVPEGKKKFVVRRWIEE